MKKTKVVLSALLSLALAVGSMAPVWAADGETKILEKVIYEDDNAALTYEGEWGAVTDIEGNSGKTVHFTGSSDATVTMDFTGCGIEVIADRSNAKGAVKVEIDGKDMGTVDCYSEADEQNGDDPDLQVVIFSKELEDGDHNITLTTVFDEDVQQFFTFDAFKVLSTKVNRTEVKAAANPLGLQDWIQLGDSVGTGDGGKGNGGKVYEIDFTGIGIELQFDKHVDKGKFDIYLDDEDEKVTTLDTREDAFYAFKNLENKAHKVKLVTCPPHKEGTEDWFVIKGYTIITPFSNDQKLEAENNEKVTPNSWGKAENDSNYSGGAYLYGGADGATVTINFTGSHISLFGTAYKPDFEGTLEVTIDGTKKEDITNAGKKEDAYPSYQQLWATYDGLSDGEHTLVLTQKGGGWPAFDYYVIESQERVESDTLTAAAAPVTRPNDDTDPEDPSESEDPTDPVESDEPSDPDNEDETPETDVVFPISVAALFAVSVVAVVIMKKRAHNN